jgi:hypothetical protein
MPHVNMRPGPMAAPARGVSHDYDTKLAEHSSWRKLMPLALARLPSPGPGPWPGGWHAKSAAQCLPGG